MGRWGYILFSVFAFKFKKCLSNHFLVTFFPIDFFFLSVFYFAKTFMFKAKSEAWLTRLVSHKTLRIKYKVKLRVFSNYKLFSSFSAIQNLSWNENAIFKALTTSKSLRFSKILLIYCINQTLRASHVFQLFCEILLSKIKILFASSSRSVVYKYRW